VDEDAYVLRGSSGFGFRENTLGSSKVNLFGGGARKPPRTADMEVSK
jgi:nitrate reductase beta subunit